MIGKRRYECEPCDYEPGEFGKWAADGYHWYACTPNGHGANLSSHNVVEHADGTITVSPSIKVSTSLHGKPVEVYHGFLERGIWRPA